MADFVGRPIFLLSFTKETVVLTDFALGYTASTELAQPLVL